jgi:hypothetical protein
MARIGVYDDTRKEVDKRKRRKKESKCLEPEKGRSICERVKETQMD